MPKKKSAARRAKEKFLRSFQQKPPRRPEEMPGVLDAIDRVLDSGAAVPDFQKMESLVLDEIARIPSREANGEKLGSETFVNQCIGRALSHMKGDHFINHRADFLSNCLFAAIVARSSNCVDFIVSNSDFSAEFPVSERLMTAAYSSADPGILRSIIRGGGDINMTSYGDCPLWFFCFNHYNLILLPEAWDSICDINAVDYKGRIGLEILFVKIFSVNDEENLDLLNRYGEVLSEMMMRGADEHLKNDEGLSPMDIFNQYVKEGAASSHAQYIVHKCLSERDALKISEETIRSATSKYAARRI